MLRRKAQKDPCIGDSIFLDKSTRGGLRFSYFIFLDFEEPLKVLVGQLSVGKTNVPHRK